MFFERPDQVPAPLYVVTSVFNSPRWRSRWKLYEDFTRLVSHSGAILYTVEVAFGQRHFAVTEARNPQHLQLRTRDEWFMKENSLNLLVQRLPADWQAVAVIDADVVFARSDWANECLHMLQHYDVVQLWTHALDLGPCYEPIQQHRSFVDCWQHQVPTPPGCPPYHTTKDKHGWINYHPGFAWGYTRAAWNALGGMIDTAVLGSADRHMALGLVGAVAQGMPRGLTEGYKRPVLAWQERAQRAIKQRIGVMEGTLLHMHHGDKSRRGYDSRWRVLLEERFDPSTDLQRDAQGLWTLVTDSPRQIRLRRRLHAYFRGRNEDSGEH